MSFIIFVFKSMCVVAIELITSYLIAGDYFRGRRGLIVDILAAMTMILIGLFLSFGGAAWLSICDKRKLPEGEPITFDYESCSKHAEVLSEWGELFQTSLGLNPVLVAILFYFIVKWGLPLLRR